MHRNDKEIKILKLGSWSVFLSFLFHCFLLRVFDRPFELVAVQLHSSFFQRVQVRLDVVLEFPCAFVIHCFGLVVQPAVVKDSFDILTEMLSVFVLVVGQLFLDGLDVGGVLDYQRVVRHVFYRHGLSEGPN